MTIRAAVFSILDGDAALTALIVSRVYRGVIPQQGKASSYMPCITYSKTGERRNKTYCGTDGLVRNGFAVDAYAVTAAEAEAVAEAAKQALMDYRGAVDGVFIADVELENEFDLEDIEPGLYRVTMNFTLWHRPAE